MRNYSAHGKKALPDGELGRLTLVDLKNFKRSDPKVNVAKMEKLRHEKELQIFEMKLKNQEKLFEKETKQLKEKEDRQKWFIKELERKVVSETDDNILLNREMQEIQETCPNIKQLKRDYERNSKEVVLKLMNAHKNSFKEKFTEA